MGPKSRGHHSRDRTIVVKALVPGESTRLTWNWKKEHRVCHHKKVSYFSMKSGAMEKEDRGEDGKRGNVVKNGKRYPRSSRGIVVE